MLPIGFLGQASLALADLLEQILLRLKNLLEKKKKILQTGLLERILISKWTSRTSTNEFTRAGVLIINGFTWTSRTSNKSFKMDLLTIDLSGL